MSLKDYESESSAIRRIMGKESEEVEENINIDEGLKDQLTPKLIQLLRMGMVDQEDLEVMKRAIKTDRNSLKILY